MGIEQYASIGGQASVVARRQRSIVRADHQAELDELLQWCDREQLAPSMIAGALKLAVYGTAGDPGSEPLTPGERLKLVEAAQILHKMARLELGESTANTLTAPVNVDALAQRIAALQRDGVVDAESSTPPTT